MVASVGRGQVAVNRGRVMTNGNGSAESSGTPFRQRQLTMCNVVVVAVELQGGSVAARRSPPPPSLPPVVRRRQKPGTRCARGVLR